jgi:hypothetical protein
VAMALGGSGEGVLMQAPIVDVSGGRRNGRSKYPYSSFPFSLSLSPPLRATPSWRVLPSRSSCQQPPVHRPACSTTSSRWVEGGGVMQPDRSIAGSRMLRSKHGCFGLCSWKRKREVVNVEDGQNMKKKISSCLYFSLPFAAWPQGPHKEPTTPRSSGGNRSLCCGLALVLRRWFVPHASWNTDLPLEQGRSSG